jgi:hypothetical protein
MCPNVMYALPDEELGHNFVVTSEVIRGSFTRILFYLTLHDS